MINTFYFILY